MAELNTLFLFEPIYKPVIWGGDKIASLKQLAPMSSGIGESWEISAVPGFESVVAEGPYKGKTITELVSLFGPDLVGNHSYKMWGDTFPLLVKFIDARESLSIQVHPDDELANDRHNSRGKTEMWYIVDAAPDSKIFSGISAEVGIDEFCKKSEDGSLIELLASYPVKRGQFYFIPAGTVHAIGAGTMVAEIQETSDISYRIFDYNRKDSNGNARPLHIEEARSAIDFNSIAEGPVNCPCNSRKGVVKCKFFNVDYIKPNNKEQWLEGADDSFSIIMAVHGDMQCRIENEEFFISKGSTALIPASVKRFAIKATEPYLLISLPTSL